MTYLEQIAALALSGLLANPNIVNSGNIFLENEEKTPRRLSLLAFRAYQAAEFLCAEIESQKKDAEDEGKQS